MIKGLQALLFTPTCNLLTGVPRRYVSILFIHSPITNVIWKYKVTCDLWCFQVGWSQGTFLSRVPHFRSLQRAGRSGQTGLSVTCLESRSVPANASFCSLRAASVLETPPRAGHVFLIPISSQVRAERLVSVTKSFSSFREEMSHRWVLNLSFEV